MFRMWVKEWKDNHMIRDITICDAADPRIQRIDKTRFSKDSFIEEVPFDYLEIHVIEEDDDF